MRSPNLFRVLSQIDSKQILVFILDKFALSQIDSEQILVFVLDKFTKKKPQFLYKFFSAKSFDGEDENAREYGARVSLSI